MRKKIDESVPRDSEGAPCFCGGYADLSFASPTAEEIKKYDCGNSWACCTAVFKCRLCGEEFIAELDAPEVG